jgi:hypothetical protein
MHHRLTQRILYCGVAPGVLYLTLGLSSVRADDSGFFSRLFHLGNGGAANANSAASSKPGAQSPYNSNSGAAGRVAQPATSNYPSQFSDSGSFPPPPSTPAMNSAGPAPRLAPKPRVSSAVTTADPLLTRIAIGRSNDGSPFAMSMQIFSDGTVIDAEGVHRLRPGDLRPIHEAVQSGDLYRLRGHCGAASTDYIEYVHLIVFERRMGRLMAHSFSYSGNPQGCDHVVRHLHTALENLQVKLSRPPAAERPATSGPAAMGASPLPGGPGANPGPLSPPAGYGNLPTRQPTRPLANPGGPGTAAAVIPLTPLDQPR